MKELRTSLGRCVLLLILVLFWNSAHASDKEAPCSRLQNAENSLAHLDRQISVSPESVVAYTNRAFFLLNQNRRDLALKDFDKVIQLAPQSAAGYVARGMVYSEAGASDRATADFLKACSLGDTSGCSFANAESSIR